MFDEILDEIDSAKRLRDIDRTSAANPPLVLLENIYPQTSRDYLDDMYVFMREKYHTKRKHCVYSKLIGDNDLEIKMDIRLDKITYNAAILQRMARSRDRVIMRYLVYKNSRKPKQKQRSKALTAARDLKYNMFSSAS